MRPPSVPDSRGLFPQAETGEQHTDQRESVLDASSAVDGLFRVGHNLRIEGEAKGEIQCEGTLTVAEGARVAAKVVAANVVVAGSLNGEVTCRERFQILPSGRVNGTVTTASLSIQEGAIYEGELHMQTTPGETRPQPPAARAGGSAGAGRGRAQAANGRAEEAPPPGN
jgi:cytoskeletal protein CcmA (bactofilin family)